jgi:DTW domain-containing protein YfiP
LRYERRVDPLPKRPIRGFRVSRCVRCRLPESLCACAFLPRLAVRTRLVVVMHRREAITSTNTGRLAVLMLEGAEIRVQARTRPEGPGAPLPEGRRLVLFPRGDARVLGPEDAAGDAPVLLVPDGTWSQARRLVHRAPELAGAEPVTLPPGAPSRYQLRASPREAALCTLEAIARALGVLEGHAVEEALLTALDRFVERGLTARAGRLTL